MRCAVLEVGSKHSRQEPGEGEEGELTLNDTHFPSERYAKSLC